MTNPLIVEVWTRPGHPNFGRIIADPPFTSAAIHDGVNLPGDGGMKIPASFDRFTEILHVDPVTPANSVSSLVRITDPAYPEEPFEWLPGSMMPTTDRDDPNVDVAGRGIKSILGYARVEAWDWDGSADFVPTFPDWIYGGRNVLADPGFETPTIQPTVYDLLINATGGTYTLTDGTNTTSALAWNASDGAIETAIESASPAPLADDVLVTPIAGGYQIETVGAPANNWTVNIGSLTGGTPPRATLARSQTGALQPSGWTKNRQVSFGTPRDRGVYTNFRVVGPSTEITGPVHSGNYSLWINPGAVTSVVTQFAGAQQVVSVTPGGIYQASIWVYSVTGGDYRLVIREIDEDLIVWNNVTIPAATWTQVSIADVQIPEGATQVIFRFANVEPSGTPSDFYLDDAEFNEGMAATTIGQMLRELYEDATVDHIGRVVWEDEANPGTAYLTLDFSDTLDSNGDAWAHSELTVKFWMRMTYFQVMDHFAQTWGYEWRVVPDDYETGTWLLQVYNPDGMETDYTTAANPAIQGGSSDVRRGVRTFMPVGTDLMVEGLQRVTARAANATLVGALGRIESARLDNELPSLEATSDAVDEDTTYSLLDGVTYPYTLADPVDIPLFAYKLGDRLTIHDPPVVDTDGRLADVEATITPSGLIVEAVFLP